MLLRTILEAVDLIEHWNARSTCQIQQVGPAGGKIHAEPMAKALRFPILNPLAPGPTCAALAAEDGVRQWLHTEEP